MYRKCPEHPEIREILQNGESNEGSRDNHDQCAMPTFYLPEQDFEEFCLKRKQKMTACKGNHCLSKKVFSQS